MNFGINSLVGLLAIGFGIYSHIQRTRAPESITKLQALIERNGEKMGHSIYRFGYTILPILAGLLLIYSDYRGGFLP